MAEAPDLLKLSVREGTKALEKEERQAGEDMRAFYAPLFRSYREELRRAFLGHFVLKPVEPGAPPVTVWDPLVLMDPEAEFPDLSQLSEALAEESDEFIEGTLDEAMEEGHRRELWLLGLGGLDPLPYADSLPDSNRRAELLLVGGIAGLSWRERLRAAARDFEQRTTRWVSGSVRGGRSLDDTLDGVDRMGAQFANRATALVGNEMYRAFGSGAAIALAAARRDHDITEVWVTREDKIVCPLCAALHLTVTLKQPVTDSHPACRCGKVPVPVGFTPTAKSYREFQRELAAFQQQD